MKLDADCVRDVLLAVEACPHDKTVRLNALCGKLPQYAEDDLNYTCLKLIEGGFLDASTGNFREHPFPVVLWINCMTYQGHEFLETIRDNSNWGKIKNTAKKAGVCSMTALGEIAQGVAQAAITAAIQSL